MRSPNIVWVMWHVTGVRQFNRIAQYQSIVRSSQASLNSVRCTSVRCAAVELIRSSALVCLQPLVLVQRFVHVRCARTAHRLCERTIPHDLVDNEPRAPVVLADDNLGQRRTVHLLVGDAPTFGAQQRAVDQVERRVEEPSQNEP